MASFMMNGWYCAAWSREVGDNLLARRLLNIPVVLFRGQDGKATTLQDRCPHRFAPLSKGRLSGNEIQCGYHGLTFDAAGLCTGSPFNKTVPAGASVRSFPTHECWGIIWFWPGDPALADAALIPDFSYVGDADWDQGYLHIKANYLLSIDNLMDLSHIEFVHLRTFGGEGAFFEGEFSTEKVSPTEIWARWWMPNVPTPAPAKAFWSASRVNHWQDMRWTAPSACHFELGVTDVHTRRENAPSRPQAHLLTPETESTTHYFHSVENPEVNPAGAELLRIAFEEEDGPMLEAVQSNMTTDFWSERPLVLGTDRGGILVRRSLEQLIKEETSGA